MRVDARQVLDDWQRSTQGELLEEPAYVLSAREELARERQINHQHWFEWKVDEVQRVIAAAKQMELQLPSMNERAHVRQRLADYLERVVLPCTDSHAIHKIPARLRSCRQRVDRGFVFDGKQLRHLSKWDDKAGMPLLCPDDARDEAARINRRYLPAMMEALRQGCSLHSCVFTIDNPAPGKLQASVRKLFRKLQSLWRVSKRERRFPIIGGIAVLEAPLGAYRDWHPHLNVILVCDGYLDWGQVRAHWGANVHFQKLEGDVSPMDVKAALRELIKYSARAVPEKSEQHSKRVCFDRDGNERPPAPAMTDWTAAEWIEWHQAHRGLRRTRTFGRLFKVPKPQPLNAAGAIWTHADRYNGRQFERRFPLLESIPGDKSTTADVRKLVIEAFRKLLGPPGQADRARQAAAIIQKHYGRVSLAV